MDISIQEQRNQILQSFINSTKNMNERFNASDEADKWNFIRKEDVGEDFLKLKNVCHDCGKPLRHVYYFYNIMDNLEYKFGSTCYLEKIGLDKKQTKSYMNQLESYRKDLLFMEKSVSGYPESGILLDKYKDVEDYVLLQKIKDVGEIPLDLVPYIHTKIELTKGQREVAENRLEIYYRQEKAVADSMLQQKELQNKQRQNEQNEILEEIIAKRLQEEKDAIKRSEFKIQVEKERADILAILTTNNLPEFEYQTLDQRLFVIHSVVQLLLNNQPKGSFVTNTELFNKIRYAYQMNGANSFPTSNQVSYQRTLFPEIVAYYQSSEIPIQLLNIDKGYYDFVYAIV